MNSQKINETPVRTSKSFRINNIKIEDLEIPQKLEEFKNVTVSEIGSKITISSEVQNAELKYGLGENYFTK